MVMSGSGVRTGEGIILLDRLLILRGLLPVNPVCYGVAAGTTTAGAAVRPIVTGAILATATTTWAFVSPGLFDYPLYLYSFTPWGAGACPCSPQILVK